MEDLIGYGFLPEFVGRFPVTTQLHELTEDQMVAVMSRPRNALLKQVRCDPVCPTVDLFEPLACTF